MTTITQLKKTIYDGIILPPKTQFRLYKFRTTNGEWVRINRKIASKRNLTNMLKRYKAQDVYCTVSHWLNPHLLETSIKSKLRHILLGSDFILDFDDSENAYSQMKKAFKEIPNGYQLSVLRTRRGYHLWVHDFYKGSSEKELKHEMKKFVAYLKKKGVKGFDEPVSQDTRRIIRVWNSPFKGGFTKLLIRCLPYKKESSSRDCISSGNEHNLRKG